MLDIYGAYLIALSIITFIVYGVDKLKAKAGAYRIPEKVLLALSLLGGAPGGIIAMRLFRHKTGREHKYFGVLNALGVIIHVAIAIFLLMK